MTAVRTDSMVAVLTPTVRVTGPGAVYVSVLFNNETGWRSRFASALGLPSLLLFGLALPRPSAA